jgi:hypothetical protein
MKNQIAVVAAQAASYGSRSICQATE